MAFDIEYEIVEELGALSPASKGWSKEVNLISWNKADVKIDIRSWAENHKKMSKGISLTIPEAEQLYMFLGAFLRSRQEE